MDFAAVTRSDRTRLPPANDRRSFAGAGLARLDSNGIEIDPRYRTRGRAIEPGFRQRARSGCFEGVASANPKTQSGTAENARSPRLRHKSRKGGRCCRVTGATTAKRNPGNAGAGGEVNQGLG